MVLLKLETEPGQRQFKANGLSERETPTWAVRTRRPPWSTVDTQEHRVAPDRGSRCPNCTVCWLEIRSGVMLTLSNFGGLLFRPWQHPSLHHEIFLSRGYCIQGCWHQRRVLGPTVLSVRKKPDWKFSYAGSRMHWRTECILVSFAVGFPPTDRLTSSISAWDEMGCWHNPGEYSGKTLYRKSGLPFFFL